MKNSTQSTVSVVITNYNGREILEKSLPSVLVAYKNKKNLIKEIIVVDDASSDESVKFIHLNYPEIKVIKHKVNRGFSSTVNTGIRSASGRLIALLNNDVYPSADFMENIVEDFNDKRVFAVSLNEFGFGPTKGIFRNGFIEHDPVKTNKLSKTFWVSGGSGVFRRDIWIDIGGMDEKLLNPFYWEDIDLSYRALKLGYTLLWEPNAKVSHKHESTIGKLSKSYVNAVRERNQLLFVWKNLTSTNLFRKHLIGLVKRILLHPGYIKILIFALVKLPLVMKERTQISKSSKISDEAVFESFT